VADYDGTVNATSRRQFLTLLGATSLSAAIPSSVFAAPTSSHESFTFLFVTDAHLQPELNGVIGTDMAFKKARAIKADFAINGGDHVFDSLAVPQTACAHLV
jgi:3',5'-cyclic-AMP phosphodiesterase